MKHMLCNMCFIIKQIARFVKRYFENVQNKSPPAGRQTVAFMRIHFRFHFKLYRIAISKRHPSKNWINRMDKPRDRVFNAANNTR